MELALLIYGISLLTGLHTVFVFLLGISIILTVGGLIIFSANHDQRKWDTTADDVDRIRWFELSKPVLKTGVIVGSIVAVFMVILPSEKTAWLMVGGYVSQQIVQSETVSKMITQSGEESSKIPNKILTIINNKLDNLIGVLEWDLESTTQNNTFGSLFTFE